MTSASDPRLLEREYATTERLERRRTNVTGWLRGDEARRNRVYVAEAA